MTRTEKYRNSLLHRKCEFCVYYKHYIRDVGSQLAEIDKCEVKNKRIKYPNMHRPLCPCFLLNKEACRKIDDQVDMMVNMLIRNNMKNKGDK